MSNKDIKIAICISGQMRTYIECFPYIKKNIIDCFDTDIFISTWNNIGYKKKYGDKDKKPTPLNISSVRSMFNPKAIDIEIFNKEKIFKVGNIKIPNEYRDSNFFPKHWRDIHGNASKRLWDNDVKIIENSVYCLYKIWKCNELMKKNSNSGDYDFIIKIRPDMIINGYDKSFLNESKDILWHSNIGSSSYPNGPMVTDKFVLGGPNVIDLYSSCFLNINKYWKNSIGDNWSNSMIGERMVRHHCISNNINLKILKSSGKILRPKL